MKLREYIDALQVLEHEQGNLEVETFFVDGSRRTAYAPQVAYVLVLGPRESKPRFWSEGMDKEHARGSAVIRV